MRTVTADEIVTAFEKTGLRPVQKAIGVDLCGCALAALYELSVTGGKRDSAYDWADDQLARELPHAWLLRVQIARRSYRQKDCPRFQHHRFSYCTAQNAPHLFDI